MRLLVVVDDAETPAYIADVLPEGGHLVDRAADGRSGLIEAACSGYDLLVVDHRLPVLDGLAVVHALRAAGAESPLLFLITMDGVHDQVAGLRAGGNDYLCKPFAFAELLARVEALGRRPRGIDVGDATVPKVAGLALVAAIAARHRGHFRLSNAGPGLLAEVLRPWS